MASHFLEMEMEFLISKINSLRRMTLLLGPPSSGKTTLLLALAGKLDSDLKVWEQRLNGCSKGYLLNLC